MGENVGRGVFLFLLRWVSDNDYDARNVVLEDPSAVTDAASVYAYVALGRPTPVHGASFAHAILAQTYRLGNKNEINK